MAKRVKTNPSPKDGCERSTCPLVNTLDVIGDKWTLVVIRDILLLGKRQYSEFLESPEGISTNILADRLKRLEDAGIISKSVYQTNPERHEYRLTDSGEALMPVIAEMVQWGLKYIEGTRGPTRKQMLAMRDKHRKA